MSDTNQEKLISTPVQESSTTFFGEFTREVFSQLIDIFPETWVYLSNLFGGQVWFLILCVILSITFLADLFFRGLFAAIDRYLDRKKQPLIKNFTYAAHAPISFYIWLSGLVLALNAIIATFKGLDVIMPYLNGFKATLATIAVAWFAIRLVHRFEKYFQNLERRDGHWDPVTLEALSKIFKLTVFVITGLYVLSSLGVNLTGLIAFGGMGGIAVGFAAKDFIGNVIGGLMIYLDKPFVTGDWIRSDDRLIEGHVESIGWRMTVIRTFDKRPLYIPNGTFSTITIENPSRMSHRRIREHIGIRYQDMGKMAPITSAIKQMLIDHPDIASDQTLIVNFDVFNASSLDIFVYTFTKTTNWIKYHEVRQDVFLKIAEIVESHGAEFAFPSQSLYIENTDATASFHQMTTNITSEVK